jgi:hypothetical protein
VETGDTDLIGLVRDFVVDLLESDSDGSDSTLLLSSSSSASPSVASLDPE